MEKLEALGKTIYYDEKSTVFSSTEFEAEETKFFPALPPLEKLISATKPTAYTFCIDISDACNLRCDYCFNKTKTGKRMDAASAIHYLETMFAKYTNGEKYFIDMSGKGEPLLAIKTVLAVARWCKQKQDEIRKEVLPQFVCNGTLLSPTLAEVLQREGILFGVSLDGDKDIHDLHRRGANGTPTFDAIIQNVKAIKSRDYIGCAATLTRDVFPLVEAIDSLLPIFRTISFRPARGVFAIDESSECLWEGQYERLGQRLLEDIRQNDMSIFLALMNGEDYFGRYLVRTIGTMRTIVRCDASISRFALDGNGNVFPCPACCDFGIENASWDKLSDDFSVEAQAKRCLNCGFKYFCGGECPINEVRGADNRDALCRLRKSLIAMAMVLTETMRRENNQMYDRLVHFCEEKSMRLRKDKKLEAFMETQPGLSFTQAKILFDQTCKRY